MGRGQWRAPPRRDDGMVVRGCGFRVIWRVPHDATETAREWLATHLSEGSTTSGIVDDVGDNTLDVAMTFSEVLGVGEAEGIGGQPRRSDFSLWAASFGEKRECWVPSRGSHERESSIERIDLATSSGGGRCSRNRRPRRTIDARGPSPQPAPFAGPGRNQGFSLPLAKKKNPAIHRRVRP